MTDDTSSPPPLTAAEEAAFRVFVGDRDEEHLLVRNLPRLLATLDAERARADEAYQQGFNEAKSLREDEVARLEGEVTALRGALAKGVPCVKIPALTKDGEDFAAQYIAIDPKYWNEEADRMVVRFPDMPYREWRALSGKQAEPYTEAERMRGISGAAIREGRS